ncbi:MAG: YceI family protein [Akkermansiaceae bacterium]|nr:YceI family protein [Armatimonadota bacterium]
MNYLKRLTTTFALVVSTSLGASVLLAAPQTTQKPTPKVAQASKAELATGTWSIDKAHTDIAFTVAHLGVSKTRGTFTEFDGSVVADGKKPENSSVQFAIKTASINTGNAARDGHLRGKDFFETDKYPEIAFKSTRITKRKDGFTAVGNLTMHGVTKSISLPFTVTGPQKGFKGELHMGVETALILNRKDYGLTWNNIVEGSQAVGDTVNVTINMELIK